MFKKFMTLMMVFAFLTVQADASTHSGLKAAFNELHIDLTLEWDQSDKVAYQTYVKKFTDAITDLKAKGLKDAEIINFLKSEMKDAKASADLEAAFNLISLTKMSPKDASEHMMEVVKNSYSRGASWNGESVLYITVAVLALAAVVAIAANSRPGTGGYYCYEYYCGTSCDYYGCWDIYCCN